MHLRKISAVLILATCAGCATTPPPSHDAEGLTPLHIAAGHGDAKLLLKLLNADGDANALDSRMGVSVLHKAIYSGDPVVVRLLLERGALINLQSPSNGDTPLHDALSFKKKAHGKEIIEVLLNSGANLSIRNRAGFTALELAQELKDDESVNLINAEIARRWTTKGLSLMVAVKKNNLKAVRKLLTDPTVPTEEADEQGFTPLLWAAREGMTPIVELLLQHGANPNRLDAWMGANAGHKAAYWGRTDVMKVLIKHNLDINARGLYNGYTPLHDAVSGNHFETARVLVEAGARTDIRGHDGKTPIDIARENANGRILGILGGL